MKLRKVGRWISDIMGYQTSSAPNEEFRVEESMLRVVLEDLDGACKELESGFVYRDLPSLNVCIVIVEFYFWVETKQCDHVAIIVIVCGPYITFIVISRLQ